MSKKMQKAVALRYPPEADAPFIAASEKGFRAQRLIEIARQHQVPVVEDNVALDLLSIQQVGDVIPEEAYEVIVGIFAFFVKMENWNHGRK